MWNQLPKRQWYRISSSNSIGVAIRELEMMMFLFPPNDLEVRDSPAVSGCCRCNLSQQLQTPKQCFFGFGGLVRFSGFSGEFSKKKVIECVYNAHECCDQFVILSSLIGVRLSAQPAKKSQESQLKIDSLEISDSQGLSLDISRPCSSNTHCFLWGP